MNTITPSTPTPGHTYLQGHQRVIAQALQFALLAVLLGAFLLGLPFRWEELSQVCNNPPDCASGQLTSEGVAFLLYIGLPRTVFFAIVLAYDVLVVLIGGTIVLLLVRQRPDDIIAMLTSLVIFSHATGSALSMVTLSQHPQFGWLGHVSIQFGMTLVFIFFMVFPDGHFQPYWLRFIAIPWVLFGLLGGLYPALGFLQLPNNLGSYALMAMGLLGMGAQIYRFRHISNHAQRVQTKWALYGMAILVGGQIVSTLLVDFLPWSRTLDSWQSLLVFVLLRRPIYHLSIAAFPLFVGVSIWRYRLWNIDLLIYRSVVYGLMTVLLLGLFGVSFGLIGLIFRHFTSGMQSGVAIAIAGVAFGLMFQPTRKRLKHLVDQKLYGIMIDYGQPAISGGGGLDAGVKAQYTSFPGYYGLQLVGRGGMAEVYRAECLNREKAVALKILHPHLSPDNTFRHRFLREAQVVTMLDHPNIVHLYDYGEKDGNYFMAMEYLRGPDLRDLLKARGKYPLEEALPLLKDVALALDYAHQSGVIHRDIKPSNVVMDGSRAVLTDFGVAKLVDASTRLTLTGVLGTFDYISPEQIQASESIDGRADIYSLGIMAYQLLTGELPFIRHNPGALILAHVTQPPPDPRDRNPAIPSQTAHAILRAMSKKPQDRFGSAGEFWKVISNQ